MAQNGCGGRGTRRVVVGRILDSQQHQQPRNQNESDPIDVIRLPTPQQVADWERIFFPPAHLSRRAIAYHGSLGRTKLSPAELQHLLGDVFAKQRFMLVVGPNLKKKKATTNKQPSATSSSCHYR
jgi:hypothetical protein